MAFLACLCRPAGSRKGFCDKDLRRETVAFPPRVLKRGAARLRTREPPFVRAMGAARLTSYRH